MIYIESPFTNPYMNLALEQLIFDSFPKDEEYLMLWQNENTIVIGKHQNTVREINAEYVKENNIKVARRLSGGGAVYHDLGNLNYTFIVDAGNIETINFKRLCMPLASALETMGIHAEISGRNDITIDGKKFSGNSQYIKDNRIMHHGTILFDSDLSVVGNALKVSADKLEGKGVKSVRSRVTNVKPYLSKDMDMNSFKDVMKKALFEGADFKEYKVDKELSKKVEELSKTKYETWEWNYGRSPKYSLEKRRRIEGVGEIQIFMNVEAGIIKAFETKGDYFGNGDSEEVLKGIIGCPVRREALETALAEVNLAGCYANITLSEFIDAILL